MDGLNDDRWLGMCAAGKGLHVTVHLHGDSDKADIKITEDHEAGVVSVILGRLARTGFVFGLCVFMKIMLIYTLSLRGFGKRPNTYDEYADFIRAHVERVYERRLGADRMPGDGKRLTVVSDFQARAGVFRELMDGSTVFHDAGGE